MFSHLFIQIKSAATQCAVPRAHPRHLGNSHRVMPPGNSLSASGLMAIPALQGLRAMSVCGISLENETAQPFLKVCLSPESPHKKLEVWGRVIPKFPWPNWPVCHQNPHIKSWKFEAESSLKSPEAVWNYLSMEEPLKGRGWFMNPPFP